MKVAEYWQQDLSAATQNIMLEATELGLGSVWLGTAPKEEEIVVKKKNKKKKRGANFDTLPVEIIEYKLDDTACPECGKELHVMKKEVRKELKIIPAQVKIIEHVKYIYACRNCENIGIKATIVGAKAPAALVPKSFVSPSVLSYIMNQKYVNAMPLDRQEKEFKRQGVNLPKQNLSNWVIKGARLLQPLQKRLKNELVQQDILHADETTLEVLKEPGRTAECKSYMWVYRTVKAYEKQIILFDYTQGRAGKFAKEYLKNFEGFLHVDGYAGYKQLKAEGVILCGCWVHARRKFDEALKVIPKEKQADCDAAKALKIIAKLFKLRSTKKDKNEDFDNKNLEAIVKEFYDFVDELRAKTLPESLLGKALIYAENQKEELTAFLQDDRIELTNNSAENAIRPFVVGRKNWLFCNTPGGANASAVVYSVIQTALANNLKPQAYLQWFFEQIQLGVSADDERLLPWSEAVPLDVRLDN